MGDVIGVMAVLSEQDRSPVIDSWYIALSFLQISWKDAPYHAGNDVV